MTWQEALGLRERGILTCVGAGGKSSLLMSLGTELREKKSPFLLTATTKMFFPQVQAFAPVIARDWERGRTLAGRFLEKHGSAAWFRRWYGQKIEGLPASWIDELYLGGLAPLIMVEGDGARRKLLKAPGVHEPVVPSRCTHVAGVLNLEALDRSLSPELVHRPERAAELLGKKMGERIEIRDYAVLAGHKHGIFQGTEKTEAARLLVLTSAQGFKPAVGREILLQVQSMGQVLIAACIMTAGFGRDMKPLRVISG